MAGLALYLLGPPRFELGGTPLHIGRSKAVALLAYLAVEAGQHRRDELATLLWPEHDQSSARADLRRTLSQLNRALRQGWLLTDRETAGLNPKAALQLDVQVFRERLAACEALSDADAVPLLEEAAALYRGDFLAGFTLRDCPDFDEWAFFQNEGLREQLALALQRLAGWHADEMNYEAAIPHARRWLALDPLLESAHRELMALYAQAGQASAALRQYELCRETLAEELGLEPSPETTSLYERIRSRQLGPPRPAPSVALLDDLPSHNLPAQPNSFIGRARELAELLALIADPDVRLVTVVGPGGMGKTRLALQAAADALERFPEGVWLAELARIADPDAVPLAVATALGAQPQPGRDLTDTLVDALGTRQMLLLLDNCEHLLDAVAPLVERFLARCPGLSLLATSREALRVPGERLFEAPPMAVSDLEEALDDAPDRLPAGDAVQLFLARAQAVRPSFAVTEENAAPVVDICRRLDGVPLAIELAAARARALSPQEIASRLDDRFRLLTSGGRAAPPRQQTLRNAVTWSYELLESAESDLFDRLSVFRGGFTLSAVEGICAGDGVEVEDVLDLLAGLVDKSLVVAPQSDEPVTRYRLLETLRQFGEGQLQARGEADTLRLRHAQHFLGWAEELEPRLDAWDDWAELFKQLDPETDNLAAAMRWSLAQKQAEIALRLGGALKWWLVTRRQSGQYATWLKRALPECKAVAPRYRAKALHTLNLHNMAYNLFDESSADLAVHELEAAEEAQDPDLVALALLNLGRTAAFAGESERALEHYQRSLEIGREISSHTRIVHASVHLAMYEEADEVLAKLEALLPQTPRGWRFAVLARLAGTNFTIGNLLEAERHNWAYFEAVGELGSAPFQAVALQKLGEIAMLQGDYERAEALLERGSRLAQRSGAMLVLVETMRLMGETAWYRGDVDTAESRWNEALGLARQHGGPVDIAAVQRWLSYPGCAAGDFGRAAALGRESLAGYSKGPHYARSAAPLALARVAFFSGDPNRAAELFQECPQGLKRTGNWPDMIRSLDGLAWAVAALSRYRQATRLLGFLARKRELNGMVVPPVDLPHHQRALQTAREALGEQAFAAAWAEGEAMNLEELLARVSLE